MISMTAAAAAMLVLGCEYEPADYPDWDQPDREEPARPEDFILRSAQGEVVGAQVTNEHITGPIVSLGRYTAPDDHAIRGQALGYIVNLEVDGPHVKGLIGATPVDITTARADGAVRVRGLIRGFISDFTISDEHLTGTVGRCTYDLTRADRTYEGTRSCRSPVTQVWMKMPASFNRWSDAELGAALGVLLSR